jgi:diguanylate cyclase (GGDEF)-like protein/PAS domain S-box-containing protein
MLLEIVTGTASATSEALFGELVRHLASALNVRYAFLGEFLETEGGVRTIAVWSGERPVRNFDYGLRGTPCEQVVGRTSCHHARDVRRLFPNDTRLAELRAESYLGTPLFSSSGDPLGIVGVIDDRPMDDPVIALDVLRIFGARAAAELERKRSADVLRQSEGSLRALLNATDDTALLIDADGAILSVNDATERRFRELTPGLGDDGLLGRCAFDFFPQEIAQVRRARNEEVVRTGRPARFEDERGGRWTDNSLYPVLDRRGKVVRIAVFSRDITDRKLAERQMAATLEDLAASREALAEKSLLLEQALISERERARRDPLTGALNHGAVTLALRELVERRPEPATFAALVADVNGMKVINDTYGHLAGDSVLVAVSDVLQREGAIVGRSGGDEFVVVLDGADRRRAVEYRTAVLNSFASTNVIDPETGATVQIAVSIGIAIFPEEAQTVVELLRRSDEDMYAVKRQRPLIASGFAAARLATDDRIASAVGDLVPIIASHAPLGDKLRAVAHRLAMRAGYAAVNFDLFDDSSGAVVDQSAFVKTSDSVLAAWRRQQLQIRNHPIGLILNQTRAPFIMDDLSRDEHLTKTQRDLLAAAGVHSGICVPLIAHDAVIGVMSVGSRVLAAFGERDAVFLGAVAAQLAPLIDLVRRSDAAGYALAG